MVGDKTISAVMFVRNEEFYIKEAISGVLNQSIFVDEIIIIDDSSIDLTKNIVEKEKKDNINIKLLTNKKRGKAYSCELGLQNVKTDLFFICSGDDVLSKQYVEKMYEYISVEGIKYAYSNYLITDEDLVTNRFISKGKYYNKYQLLCDCYTGGYLFGYTEIISHLLPFPNGLTFEDWYIAIVLSQRFGGNHVNNKPLFKYRRHSDSDSTNILNNRVKYLWLLNRNIDLLTVVSRIVSDDFSLKVIESRLQFYDAMVNHKLSKTIKILLSELFTFRDKLSVFFFPVTLRLKYK